MDEPRPGSRSEREPLSSSALLRTFGSGRQWRSGGSNTPVRGARPEPSNDGGGSGGAGAGGTPGWLPWVVALVLALLGGLLAGAVISDDDPGTPAGASQTVPDPRDKPVPKPTPERPPWGIRGHLDKLPKARRISGAIMVRRAKGRVRILVGVRTYRRYYSLGLYDSISGPKDWLARDLKGPLLIPRSRQPGQLRRYRWLAVFANRKPGDRYIWPALRISTKEVLALSRRPPG